MKRLIFWWYPYFKETFIYKYIYIYLYIYITGDIPYATGVATGLNMLINHFLVSGV